MATRKPWIHPNGSSASLKGMEIAIPPSQTQPLSLYKTIPPPPPPPTARGVYECKPLPPAPPRRSVAASFSSEVNNAFQTPKRSVDYTAAHDAVDWEQQEEASIAVILERDVYGPPPPPPLPLPLSSYRPEIHVDMVAGTTIPDLPPDEILLPQTKQSVSKILRLTSGSTSAAKASLSPTLPSGHNSTHKIRQMMGVDVDVYEVSPVSPMSRSSVYSEDLALSVSEPDTDTYGAYYSDPDDDAAARSSRWTSWVPESPADVPSSLRIQKPGSRYSDPPASPATSGGDGATRRSSQLSSRHHHYHHQLHRHRRESSSYSTDLYHASANQIAKSSLASGQTLYSPTSPTPLSPRSNRSRSSITTTTSPIHNISPSTNERHVPLSFTDRLATSRTHARMAPPPPELRSARSPRHSPTTSPSSFGTGNHPLRTPYPSASVAICSAFDGDSDDSDASSSSRGRSSALLERGRNLFRRRSSDVVEIVAPVSAAAAGGERRWHGLVEESVREHEAAMEERERRARERLAIETEGRVGGGRSSGARDETKAANEGGIRETGRQSGEKARGKAMAVAAAAAAAGPNLSRRHGATGAPFRAMPPLLTRTGGQISGLMASAKKTVGVVGLRSREEKRRESLKSRIRVLSDGESVSDTPRKVADGGGEWL